MEISSVLRMTQKSQINTDYGGICFDGGDANVLIYRNA
jgi:hypothetical protein